MRQAGQASSSCPASISGWRWTGLIRQPSSGTCRAADGVADVAAVEAHALAGEAIQIRGRVEVLKVAAVGSNGLVGMIIGKDPDDIRPVLSLPKGLFSEGVHAGKQQAAECESVGN